MFENTDNLLLYEFILSHKITTKFLVNTTKFLTWIWMTCWKYPSVAKIPLYLEFWTDWLPALKALPWWASLTLYCRFQLSLYRRITSFLMSGNSPVFDSLDWFNTDFQSTIKSWILCYTTIIFLPLILPGQNRASSNPAAF